VTPGLTTWDEVRPAGNVLLVCNARDVNETAAGALLSELLQRTAHTTLHIVADRQWSPWIEKQGFSGESVRLALDRFGEPLDVNYFLEQPDTVRWAASRQIRTIAGSSPHNLYNEEVQDVFERRAALLIGAEGRLLAHTLPHRYVYIFDLAGVLERIARGPKIAAYQAVTRALVDDLYRVWKAEGEPPTADGGTFDDVLPSLRAHLGTSVFEFDELSPIPIPQPSSFEPIARMVNELRTAYLRLADEHARRTATVAVREDARDLLRRLRGRNRTTT
jgi:hypothetical protein